MIIFHSYSLLKILFFTDLAAHSSCAKVRFAGVELACALCDRLPTEHANLFGAAVLVAMVDVLSNRHESSSPSVTAADTLVRLESKAVREFEPETTDDRSSEHGEPSPSPALGSLCLSVYSLELEKGYDVRAKHEAVETVRRLMGLSFQEKDLLMSMVPKVPELAAALRKYDEWRALVVEPIQSAVRLMASQDSAQVR